MDAEHALDPEYAKGMGVNFNDLYVAQPDSGEDALEIVDTLVRSGAMSVIVVVSPHRGGWDCKLTMTEL